MLKSLVTFSLAFTFLSGNFLIANDATSEKVEQEEFDYDQLKKNAFSLAKAGRPDEAINEINRVIANQPDSPWGYKLRGNINFYTKDYEAALKDFDQVVKLRPMCANAYVDLSIALLAVGLLDEAWSNIERAIAIKPMSAFAYNVREKIYLEKQLSKTNRKK